MEKIKTIAKVIKMILFSLAEHDIFGGAVSDSDEEPNINIMEMEDTSRMSADSSRLSDSASRGVGTISSAGPHSSGRSKTLVTEFSKEMFSPSRRTKDERTYPVKIEQLVAFLICLHLMDVALV